jgi:hypothetical protein
VATEISIGGGTSFLSKAEGQSGSTPFTFTITRTGDLSGASSIAYAVDPATGSANASDFVGGVRPSDTVSFAASESSKTVTLPVAGDTAFEPDELFNVYLTNPLGATLKPGGDFLQYTIVNDDPGTQSGVLTLTGPPTIAEQPDIATYTVTRAGTGESVSYNYSMVGTGASPISAADFANGQLPSGVLSFPQGTASRDFTISIPIDGIGEPTEQFTLIVTSASGLVTYATLVGNVKDTTVPPSTVTIANSGPASKYEGDSGATTFDFIVTRTGDISGTGSVHYTTGNIGAQASDFVGGILPSGTLTFAPGQASQTISIEVVGDTLLEGDEVFSVALDNASNMNMGSISAALATILNDDVSEYLASFAGGNPRVEGGTVTYTLTRGDVSKASVFTYEVAGHGASPANASDFVGGVLPTGIVFFAAGEATKIISIATASDTVIEQDEGFSLTVRNSLGSWIAGGGSWIVNDDGVTLPLPQLKVTSPSAGMEGDAGSTAFVFTIERETILYSSSDISQRTPYEVGESSVAYSVVGVTGLALSADDFVGGILPSGTVSFAAGEKIKTVTINVKGDTTPEQDEPFQLVLSNPVNASLPTYPAVTIIIDDDLAPTSRPVTATTAAAQTLFTAWNNILGAPLETAQANLLNAYGDAMTRGVPQSTPAIDYVISAADGTTSVATMAYGFFTGKIPSEAGMAYLVSPTGPNPNNLNSAYYQGFSVENRYINFAVNLGKLGEGAGRFAADYGGLDLFAATTKAYQTIFGTAPTAEKVHALLDPSFIVGGAAMTRAQYFEAYGQDGPNGIGTKAAMVGWLLAEAEKADVGIYAKANHAFLVDLADGAALGVDLIGVYGRPDFAL